MGESDGPYGIIHPLSTFRISLSPCSPHFRIGRNITIFYHLSVVVVVIVVDDDNDLCGWTPWHHMGCHHPITSSVTFRPVQPVG